MESDQLLLCSPTGLDDVGSVRSTVRGMSHIQQQAEPFVVEPTEDLRDDWHALGAVLVGQQEVVLVCKGQRLSPKLDGRLDSGVME